MTTCVIEGCGQPAVVARLEGGQQRLCQQHLDNFVAGYPGGIDALQITDDEWIKP